MDWKTFDGKPIGNDLCKIVSDTLLKEKNAGNSIRICIGTDSRVQGVKIEFATVIVFLRVGRGGFMYVKHESVLSKMSINQRMMTEVIKSVEIAYILSDLIGYFNVPLEVHADINTDPHFKSNNSLKEAMGYIVGMGFTFKAKPEAFASSYCADHAI